MENAPQDIIESERINREDTEPSHPTPNLYFSSQEFSKWINLSLAYLLTFFLLLSWQKLNVPLYISVVPSLLSDSIMLLRSSYIYKSQTENYQKRIILKEIIENSGSLLMKILIILYLQIPNFLISYALIPLVISTITNLCIKSISFNKCQIFSEIMFIMVRIARLLTCTSIFLRIDNFYSFDWSLTFWPIWSFISLIGIIVIGLLLYSMNLYSTGSYSRTIFIGSSYLILSMTASLICSAVFFFSLSSSSPNFYPPLIFLFIFILVSIASNGYLKLALVHFFADEIENNTQVVPSSEPARLGFVSALNKPPQFLVKLSSSYFKQAPAELRPRKKRTSSLSVAPSQDLCYIRPTTNEQVFRKSRKSSTIETVDADKCSICSMRIGNAVIIKCGHGGICYDCADKLKQTGSCHICRGSIDLIARVLPISNTVHEIITEIELS